MDKRDSDVPALDDLQHTLQLLRKEQDEDRTQYREKVLQSSLAERRNMGVTWYPIVIKESYYGMGERLILEIERPTNTELSHQFQTGGMAAVFSNYHNEGKDNPSVNGVIAAVRPNQIKIVLSVDELPEWTSSGKLGLDLLFDETSYKEMEDAMHQVMKAASNRLAELRETILGSRTPSFSQKYVHEVERLNESQNDAFKMVARAEDVAVVHGPPGTGKTTTLIECILETLKKEKQVLVTAPSNTAVDLLTEQLALRGANVLRIGNPARVSETLQAHTVDAQISNHASFKQIKEFRKRAAEYRNMGMKYKRNFGREEREQRKMIFDEAKKLQQEAEKIEKYITDDLLSKAQVITATLVASANFLIRNRQYETVFIDEAGQALEPACWIPIIRAKRVVMAGDHLQLPPTVKSIEASRKGLSTTLLEKLSRKKTTSVMLRTQYRMHEMIMNFPNAKFYEGQLVASDLVKHQTLNDQHGNKIPPMEFIDTAGCGFEETQDKENQSLSNPGEADLLVGHLKAVLEDISNKDLRIGIISPYRSQVNYIKEKIRDDEFLSSFPFLSVNTVDGFQGQEREIICISLVRCNSEGEIGFLSDTRRMNVAMTRAKKLLVIIGDSATLGAHPFYNNFLQYIEANHAYKSAWEFM